MELRVLEYYLMVAREENITKAADLLHITQPTLSRQVAQMEEEFGCKLFKRGKHSITLTEEGLLLKRRAQEMLDLAAKTRSELKRDERNYFYWQRRNKKHASAGRLDDKVPSKTSPGNL